MTKTVIFALFSFLFINVNAQSFNPQILVLSEQLTEKDFSFLKEQLQNAQVVMLGENTHFDGNIFEAKTEIIKYLFNELGFKTIAFESGVYDVWKAQNSIIKGENTKTAFEKSLFPIWSKTVEFQSFIAFFEKHRTQLKVFGFDNQITGEYGENELVKDLYDYCATNKLALNLNKDDFELLLESINNSGVFDEGDISYEKYKSSLTSLLQNIEKKPSEKIHFYWKQIVQNLLSIGKSSYFEKESILSTFNTTSDDNSRDRQMADNLLAYIRANPNEKIICWGANAHFVNDMSSVKTPIAKEFIPMGSYIKKELGEKLYSLAAITAADSIYLNKVWSKTPIIENSFEQFLKSKNKMHVFISAKQDEMKQPRLNRLFSPIDFIDARLDLLHDGYLYFDKVKQSTLIEEEKNNNDNKNPAIANADLKVLESKSGIEPKMEILDEVLITSYPKKFTYSIVSKAIENINKNYPVNAFNSKQATNIDVKVQNETAANIDFINDQYDRGYHQIDRNSKQLKQVRWNVKNDYVPENIRQFWSLSYNNPIMYGRYFNVRKSKKFVFKLSEIKIYNNKEVYVIDFSIPRNHFTYTQRSISGNYSGTLFINKDDFAIVRVIEHWTFIENQETTKYDIHGWNEKYIKREIISETVETNFDKINNQYYLSNSEIAIIGKLYDRNNNPYPLNINIASNWIDFQTANPIKISYKEELNLFEKVAFNTSFWEKYDLMK